MEKVSMNYSQGSIFLVPFPFSDLSGSKVRPVVVLSNDFFNLTSSDLIVCAITSKKSKSQFIIPISNSSLKKGTLFKESYVKVENVKKIEKALLIKEIGSLTNSSFNKVKTLFFSLFN
jgi:mRNA interferase MazF